MSLPLDPEARAALDLAKRSVPEGGELDVGLLLAALYHATDLKDRLPERLSACLERPSGERPTVPEKVPLAKPLQPLLARVIEHGVAVTPAALLGLLLDSDAAREYLRAAGLSDAELAAVSGILHAAAAESAQTTAPPAGETDWRTSPERRAALEALDAFGRMLTATEPPDKGLFGMDETLRALVRTLSRMKRRNAIIIGPSGVGKSAAIYELARRLYHRDPLLPPHLRDLDLFELSPVFLRSGASMVGQYEERIKALLQVLEAHPKILLFVDEIHSLLRSGMHDRGPFSDANEAFKVALSKGIITCLGCTTPAEYRNAIEPDVALAQRFATIRVAAPTPAVTVDILKTRRPRLERYFAPPPLAIPDAILEHCVALTEEYLPARFQPAKSLQLLDEACAWCVTSDPRPAAVTDEALWAALESTIGHGLVRAGDLTEDDLRTRLQAKIIGQDDTLAALARSVVAGLGGWMKRSAPRGVFFFCGPTGVGKTATAELLGRLLGGGSEALIRINCNTLQGSGHDSGPATNLLLGPPPGFVGYVRGAGGLLSKIRDLPESILLFDEIEKADPGVAKLLLQVMDEGRVEDNDGNLLDFRRAFIVFTTNAGAVYAHRSIGFGSVMEEAPDTPVVEVDAVKQALRAIGYGEEFLGRIDAFFVFRGLASEAIRRIVAQQLERLRTGADVQGYRLAWDQAVVDYLAERWQPRFGVRHLTTILRNRIVEQLSVAAAQRELDGVNAIRLRVLALTSATPGGDLAGLASRARDGETLWINLT
ncbi:AAA family ATPase [Thiocapsa marina]|uniref:ATPase AAA-2 domain protein n=1 Tax=Thiocapsa marina 5811 TaxID=768671 RepID=F9UHP5_9GAMM|nr:AAA family ATPase [Thiocapsa marina]EGV16221.1 ATPase AAA-2 domain protein [Thiocapsa marina 5811]